MTLRGGSANFKGFGIAIFGLKRGGFEKPV
jgi:hypothetical protein